MAKRLDGLRGAQSTHAGLLCDVWGVLHNGETVYAEAAEALANFRAGGGHVVMITNSPRRSQGVLQQFETLGVSNDVFDAVVTSGDATRDLINQVEGPLFHLGPERDSPLFADLDVNLTTAQDASAIICTGLFSDEVEKPDDYRELLSELATRRLPFICANPDIVVERGDRMIWCAGALARLYEQLGGAVSMAGKPHPPIYELAYRKMKAIAGRPIDKSNLLAIGDGLPTDIAGGEKFGSDVLYISGGIHAAEYGGADAPNEAKLQEFLKVNGAAPDLWMPRLIW